MFIQSLPLLLTSPLCRVIVCAVNELAILEFQQAERCFTGANLGMIGLVCAFRWAWIVQLIYARFIEVHD
jgi:hypothetical protein